MSLENKTKMRLNLKMSLGCLCVAAVFITLSVWTKCGGDLPNLSHHLQQVGEEAQVRNKNYL